MPKTLTDISTPDDLLLQELKNDNVKAFDLIFKKYYSNLCRFAYSLIHDADMSQSLVQNVFVKLWERRFIGQINNLPAYLSTMVRNQCCDYLQELSLLDKGGVDASNIHRVDNSTENEVFRKNFEESLIAALGKLPTKCRTAFEYSRFENLSNKEIAQRMEISIKGVEALIGRSLKTLRIELHEFLPSQNSSKLNSVLLFLRFGRTIFTFSK